MVNKKPFVKYDIKYSSLSKQKAVLDFAKWKSTNHNKFRLV